MKQTVQYINTFSHLRLTDKQTRMLAIVFLFRTEGVRVSKEEGKQYLYNVRLALIVPFGALLYWYIEAYRRGRLRLLTTVRLVMEAGKSDLYSKLRSMQLMCNVLRLGGNDEQALTL